MSLLGNPVTQLRKVSAVETTQLLLANATFTGPWHDTVENGEVTVEVISVSNVLAAATVGLQLQTSDDQINLGFQTARGGATTVKVTAIVRQRFWRIVYVNGVSVQTSFSIIYTTLNSIITTSSGTGPDEFTTIALSNGALLSFGDNAAAQTGISFQTSSGQAGNIAVYNFIYGGAFSGTPDATRQGYSRARTPTVFRNVSTVATGSTALWTPGAGNKFRLLRYIVQVTFDAAAAAAGDLTIKLLDAAGDIAQNLIVAIPAASVATGPVTNGFSSNLVDLGLFGILSALANNVLNVNLSFALTAGKVNVIAMGVEE